MAVGETAKVACETMGPLFLPESAIGASCDWQLPVFGGRLEQRDWISDFTNSYAMMPRGSGDGDGGSSSPTGGPLVFLTSVELAQMLRLSPRSLEKMRLEKRGPPYIRLGVSGRSKVLYRISDVEEWIQHHIAN